MMLTTTLRYYDLLLFKKKLFVTFIVPLLMFIDVYICDKIISAIDSASYRLHLRVGNEVFWYIS